MIRIIQYENRSVIKVPHLYRLMQMVAKYCYTNNMEYRLYYSYEKDIPEYWIKVSLLRDLLNEMNDDDYLVWMDSDAFIHRDFTQYLPNSKDGKVMTVSPSIKPGSTPFSSSVFMVNKGAAAIFDSWINMYDESKWRKKKGKWQWRWKSKSYSSRGCYERYLLSQHGDVINRVSPTILQCPGIVSYRDNTCIFHFSWRRKKERIYSTLGYLGYLSGESVGNDAELRHIPEWSISKSIGRGKSRGRVRHRK